MRDAYVKWEMLGLLEASHPHRVEILSHAELMLQQGVGFITPNEGVIAKTIAPINFLLIHPDFELHRLKRDIWPQFRGSI